MTLEKLLSEYFQKPELQKACYDIDEPTSYNNPELITIILNEWENKGRNKYELFEYLVRPTLSRICKAYKIDHKGSWEVLLKRIRKAKLLDNSHTALKISGIGIGSAVIIITVLGVGIDIIDFVEKRLDIEQPTSNWDSIPDGVVGNRYVNKSLGFTIEKPDDTWFFVTDFQKLREESNRPSEFLTLLGGVLVAKSITNENVGVEVLELRGTNYTNLTQRVEKIIEITPNAWNIEMYNIEKDFSLDGNYAYFTYDGINSTREFHHGRIFKIDNDKFYELGWVTEPLERLPKDVHEGIDCIVKSFTTISPQTSQLQSKC